MLSQSLTEYILVSVTSAVMNLNVPTNCLSNKLL